jgi:hypothetical protein
MLHHPHTCKPLYSNVALFIFTDTATAPFATARAAALSCSNAIATMIAGIDDDLMRIFNLLSEEDRKIFSELCAHASNEGVSSCDPKNPIVSAMLLSTIKSLAATVETLTKIDVNDTGIENNVVEISAESIALQYVEYQQLATLPTTTLLQIIDHQCSALVDSFDEKTKLNLFRYFLSCCSITTDISSSNENGASAPYVAQFEKLLTHTLSTVSSNIRRNLEDLTDFDYLWDASTDHTLLFDGDLSSEETAKELAWSLVRTTSNSVLREDGTDAQSCERRYRILHEAACIDLVLAAMLTQLLPSNGENPAAKRMRSERDAREVRQYLLNSIGELLLAVTAEEIVIQRSDLNITAQQVATSILPFVDDRKKMDSDEMFIPVFLSCISSNEQRKTSLLRLKKAQTRIVAEKAGEALSSIPAHLPNIEKALKLGWLVPRLQQRTYDHFHGFYQLDLSKRKMLASIVPKTHNNGMGSNGSSQQIVQAICYKKHQGESSMPVELPLGSMNAINISGWKEPPLSDTEREELQNWIVSSSSSTRPACCLKPSPKLLASLKASSLPPTTSAETNGNSTAILTWEMVVLPMLNNCLTQAAKDFGTTGSFTVLDGGEHIVPLVATSPGQIIMPSAILQLYYIALDVLLHHDAARRKSDANPTMVLNLRFHSSLFALCRFCLHKGNNLSASYQHDHLTTTESQSLVIEDIGTCPIVYYKLIESFIKAFAPDNEYVSSNYEGQVLPSRITQNLRRLQEMLLGLMWMRSCVDITGDFESTFVGMLNKMKQDATAWQQVCPIGADKEAESTISSNDKERMFVRYILRNLVKVTRRRLLDICKHLIVSQTSTITFKTMMVFTNMLYHRVDLFIDRHPDQLMLCSLYLVCSKMKLAPSVTFQNIKDAYMEMNEDLYNTTTLNTIFYEVKLSSSNDERGNIVSFYNDEFTPNVRPFWKSLMAVTEPTT